MVNSVQRPAGDQSVCPHVIRAGSEKVWLERRWHGTNGDLSAMLAHTPGIAQDAGGELHFTDWIAGRAEQRDHPHRRHGCALFPDVPVDL